MREIKFRAWYEGKMHPVWSYSPITETVDIKTNSWFKGVSAPIMQYTGLKDKNGVEIYEGDILRLGETYDRHYSDGDVVGVKWTDGRSGFIPFCDYHSDYDPIENYEVIGNIYENPELLEKE